MTLPSNGMQYLHNTRSGFPTVKSLFIVAAPYTRYASPPFYLFLNHGKPAYPSTRLHPQNNCTQTRSRSVQHAADTKFATKNSRSLSTSVLQRSALQFVLCCSSAIFYQVYHDFINTYLICCLAYLVFLIRAKYLDIIIHLDLS